ncbi:MAG: tetratricopeptide repeat protein [Candidatus Syntrophosphaera sp.]|nr:tetratricopeptide repeat protein [Candidatus Syntrophosphaera sp.]
MSDENGNQSCNQISREEPHAMIRYRPPFILHNFERGVLSGSLQAFVLIFDLGDFTQITNELHKAGKLGAEELARMLDNLSQGPHHWVESNGGFAIRFTGDGFWAIFPDPEPLNVLAAVLGTCDQFRKLGEYATPYGSFRIKARQCVGFGTLDWRIFENDLQNEYLFSGRVMQELLRLSELKQELVFTQAAAWKIGKDNFVRRGRGFEPDCEIPKVPPRRLEYDFEPQTALRFMNSRFQNLLSANEIRMVACCFANLEEIPQDRLEDSVGLLELLALTYGGYVNNLNTSEKGFQAVILFGMPRNEGNTVQRAGRFALMMAQAIPGISLGMSFGEVFAGFVGNEGVGEYAAWGRPMNLASRLAEKARSGEILVDARLQKELDREFSFEQVGNLRLKGFGQPVRSYRLAAKFAEKTKDLDGRFVGRIIEKNLLSGSVIDSLASRKSCVIFIHGEAGIGKTRLAQEVMKLIPDSSCQKFSLACDRILPQPLEPLKQLIRQHLGLSVTATGDEAVSQFRSAWNAWAKGNPRLAGLEILIGSWLGLSWPGSAQEYLTPQNRPQRLLEAWLAYLRELAAPKPILAWVDDAQWMDPETAWYFQAVEEAGIKTVCVLATIRDEEGIYVKETDMLHYKDLHLHLKPLSEDESREFSQVLLGMSDLPPETLDRITDQAAGNPFFIEQYITYLQENGRIGAHGEILSDAGSAAVFGINDIIASRIDRLTDKVRECVENASVLGHKFNVRVLSQMLNSDPRELLANGTQNQIWKDLDEVFYIFSHMLIQDAVYNRMLSGKLQKLHLSAAEAMERVYELNLDEHAEEIAMHFEKGGVTDKAAFYHDKAGDHNWDKGSFDRAEANFRSAIRLAAQAHGTDGMEYGEMVFHLALLYHYLLRMEEAEPLYNEVMELATRKHGTRSLALSPYINNLGRFYKDTGRFSEGEKLLKRSLAMERKQSPGSSNVADRINNLGHLYGKQNKLDKAEAMFREALELMERSYGQKHWFIATCAGNLGSVCAQTGKLEEAGNLLHKALKIARRHWGPKHAVTAIYLSNLGSLYLKLERWKDAEKHLLKALQINQRFFGKGDSRTLNVVKSLLELYDQTQNTAAASIYQDWPGLDTNPPG